MVRQLSTAFSDAILALASFNGALQLLGVSMSGFVAFALVGTAATFGAVRFSLENPSEDLLSYHKYLSWLATIIGMPYLASAYHRQENSLVLANLHLATGFALLVSQTFLNESTKQLGTEIVSGCAVVSIILLCLINFNACGLIGAVAYAVAGLVVGADGELNGIKRVDIFHYILVVANIALMLGLQKAPEPIFYKRK